MKYLFVVGSMMVLLCLSACTSVASSVEAPAQEKPNTDNLVLADSSDNSEQNLDLVDATGLTYTGEARITEDGMQDDFIYYFADGEINPAQYEPLLLVNGAFTAKGNLAYYGPSKMIPLRVVIESFGGTTTLDETTRTVVFQLEDKTIEIDISDQKFPHYYCTINGGEESEWWCLLHEDSLYIALEFFAAELGLDIGYLPGQDIGLNITPNPVIWIEQSGTHDLIEQSRTDTLEYLKKSLTTALADRVANTTGEYISDYGYIAPKIQADIDGTRYVTQVGRYAMYIGPYTILVDMQTQDIYFYSENVGFAYIYKVDLMQKHDGVGIVVE